MSPRGRPRRSGAIGAGNDPRVGISLEVSSLSAKRYAIRSS